jgi:hypothetical protein
MISFVSVVPKHGSFENFWNQTLNVRCHCEIRDANRTVAASWNRPVEAAASPRSGASTLLVLVRQKLTAAADICCEEMRRLCMQTSLGVHFVSSRSWFPAAISYWRTSNVQAHKQTCVCPHVEGVHARKWKLGAPMQDTALGIVTQKLLLGIHEWDIKRVLSSDTFWQFVQLHYCMKLWQGVTPKLSLYVVCWER